MAGLPRMVGVACWKQILSGALGARVEGRTPVHVFILDACQVVKKVDRGQEGISVPDLLPTVRHSHGQHCHREHS